MARQKILLQTLVLLAYNDRQKHSTSANRRLAKKRVECLNEALCFVSSSLLADSLVLRNPLLRQAPKRWQQPYKRQHLLR